MRGLKRMVRAFWTFPGNSPIPLAYSMFAAIQVFRPWTLRCFVEATFTPRDLFECEIAFRSGRLRPGTGAGPVTPAGLDPVRCKLAIEYLLENSILQRDQAGKC